MPKVGLSYTGFRGWKSVQSIISRRPYLVCDLMIDGFLAVDPYKIREALPNTDLTFHVMNSQFITREQSELRELAKQLDKFIRIVGPLRVSDHLAVFELDGRNLTRMAELNSQHWQMAADKARIWQDMLGTPLFLENNGSPYPLPYSQSLHMGELLSQSGCNLMFDISNAVVSALNGNEPEMAWTELATNTSYFHIAGYEYSETTPPIVIDTHASSISQRSLDLLRSLRDRIPSDSIVIVERDQVYDVGLWEQDIVAVENALTAHTL